MNDIITKIANLKNGTMFHITYKTDMGVRSAYKKAGVKVVKVTSTVTRTGVNYEHIGSVIKAKANGEIADSTNTNNYSWEIPNKVAYNSNTDCKYLQIAPVKNHSTKTYYLVTKDGTCEKVDRLDDTTLEMMTKISSGYAAPVKKIKLDNIISIG